MSRCKNCKSVFRPAPRHPKQKYCCAQCRKRELARRWRIENPQKWRGYKARYKARHGEKIRGYQAHYYSVNRERLCFLVRMRRLANPDIYRRKDRAWYRANLQKARATSERWQIRNPDKVAALSKARVAQISNSYVVGILRRGGIIRHFPAELIETKKAQLKLLRLCQNQKT